MISLSPDVKTAISKKSPVVALESTVIAHGLPRPINLDVARRLHRIVSDSGAVPATVAVLEGRLRAGLSDEELQLIAETDGIKKISIRDLPVAVANRWNGATTVATTLWIAHRAGIRVFATGGIGGVHRGPLPDISADLPELARTPMVVVCAGAKIVLDLPATREWLETYGVTVVGFQCNELPAFYSRTSGLPVDVRANTPAEVVRIVKAHRDLDLPSAILVTAPVPQNAEVHSDLLQRTLESALNEAERVGIAGRELTPFLLERMSRESDGETLRANIALLENNAMIAAQIAVALASPSVESGPGGTDFSL